MTHATTQTAPKGTTQSSTPFHWKGAKILPTALIFITAMSMWMMTPPEGLTVQTWHLFVVFLATIVGVIAKPLPMGAIVVLAISALSTTQTLKLDQCLSTFSSPVVWLIVMAFFLAKGFEKTGLGNRIAYFFMRALGKSNLGLSYGFVLTELFLAPFIPSNTARGAGIIFPVVSALCHRQAELGDKKSEHKLGSFLMAVCFHTNMITSAMFLTGLVGNPLIATFAGASGVKIDWMTWAIAAIVPGIVNLLVMPWIVWKMNPAKLETSSDTVQFAKDKLTELGSLKIQEWIMLITFGGILALWVFGESSGIDATTTAFLGLSIMLVSGILDWRDLIKEHNAWETMMWFAPLLMMATFLTKFGMMDWFSGHMQTAVTGFSWPMALVILSLIYYYVHYLFASVTAHITALYSAFLVVLIALGTPPMLAAISLAVLSSLSGTLTHFGTGTAPVYFGTGYFTVKSWWRMSFILSLFCLAIWSVVGGVWWKFLGYW